MVCLQKKFPKKRKKTERKRKKEENIKERQKKIVLVNLVGNIHFRNAWNIYRFPSVDHRHDVFY